MSYLALARKWRPKTFADMTGQSHVVRALANALDSGRVHHAFLFTGTRGVGKTTVARILAKALDCERGISSSPCGQCAACREIDEGRCVDLIEVDAASRTKVDDTRELLDNVQYAPARARFKVYLIDEVHMLSNHSFNALLKTLEEPPPHVKFLLATTDPQKLPLTVLSRCLQFNLQRLSPGAIASRLRFVSEQESLAVDERALQLIARSADGSLRDALSLLDQFLAFGGSDLSERAAREMLAVADRGRLLELMRALESRDGAAVLAVIAQIDAEAPDYDRVLSELAAILQRIAVHQIVPVQTPTDESAELRDLAASLSSEDVQLYYQIALQGRRELELAPEGRAGFEMTLLRMLAFLPGTESSGVERAEPAAEASAALNAQAQARAPERVAAIELPSLQKAAAATDINFDGASWQHWVDRSELAAMARQFALNCVPISFRDDVLTLGVDAAAAERKTPMLEEKISAALNRLVGRDLRLQFVVSASDALTPARQRMADEEQRALRAVEAFEADPAVRGLRERFGATIDPASIKAS